MKAMIKISSIFVLLIMVMSCATTPRALSIPEKYNLDNELETVDRIDTFKAPRWQYVDKQSIILRVDWKDYYLLVLRQPIYTMNPISIGLTNKIPRLADAHEDDNWALPESQGRSISFPGGSISVISGHDRVLVNESGSEQWYVIDKIYKLEGREQKEEIRKRLSRD